MKLGLENKLDIIGKQIKSMRIDAGYSQEEFAKKCRWDISRQSRIEHGTLNLTIKTLQKISKALGREVIINFQAK